jgi:hypothetical protein
MQRRRACEVVEVADLLTGVHGGVHQAVKQANRDADDPRSCAKLAQLRGSVWAHLGSNIAANRPVSLADAGTEASTQSQVLQNILCALLGSATSGLQILPRSGQR